MTDTPKALRATTTRQDALTRPLEAIGEGFDNAPKLDPEHPLASSGDAPFSQSAIRHDEPEEGTVESSILKLRRAAAEAPIFDEWK